MKKNLFLFLFFCLLLTFGCTKQETPTPPNANTGQYYVRFKADGVLREYTYQPSLTAIYIVNATQHLMQISTFNTTNNTNCSIAIYEGKELAPGTFSGYANQGTYFYGGFLSYGENGVAYGTSGLNPEVEVVLSEWTATEAKGTFSGVVKELTTSSTIQITEGEFFVKRGN
jgi:hypothetical protein